MVSKYVFFCPQRKSPIISANIKMLLKNSYSDWTGNISRFNILLNTYIDIFLNITQVLWVTSKNLGFSRPFFFTKINIKLFSAEIIVAGGCFYCKIFFPKDFKMCLHKVCPLDISFVLTQKAPISWHRSRSMQVSKVSRWYLFWIGSLRNQKMCS